ncbi:MAG: class I SAM-dependent methyltransferase [Rubricella sp.]
MTDDQTIAVYEARAQEYDTRFTNDEPDADLRRFLEAVPRGTRLLDLGCGPGKSAAHMAAAGFAVLAIDASAQMVALASRHEGVAARQARFEEVDGLGPFGGIFANFSLLHAERDTLPALMAKCAGELGPGGVLHIGMKLGTGERRDSLGRFYTFVSETELRALVEAAGLAVTFTRQGEEAGLAGTVDPYIILLARKEGAR